MNTSKEPRPFLPEVFSGWQKRRAEYLLNQELHERLDENETADIVVYREAAHCRHYHNSTPLNTYESKLDVAVKALDFYGDKDNWISKTDDCDNPEITEQWCSTEADRDGGNRATTALAKIKESE